MPVHAPQTLRQRDHLVIPLKIIIICASSLTNLSELLCEGSVEPAQRFVGIKSSLCVRVFFFACVLFVSFAEKTGGCTIQWRLLFPASLR